MPQPRTRSRALWAAAAGVLPLIPIVVAVFLGSGSGGSAGVTTGRSPLFTPLASPSAPSAKLRTSFVSSGSGALVALVEHRTPMRSRPGGHVFAHVPAHTEYGSPEALYVARLSGAWLGVVSPLAGNNHLGWIPASMASLGRVDWSIRVNLSARQLTVLESGKPVERYKVAVGAPANPTPTGRFAVTDRLNTGDPAGPYGCCILALSAKAPHAIQGWSGGDRIAIHSTPETWSIGQPVSHGCMRLTLPEGRWLLNHIPLGTPTYIST